MGKRLLINASASLAIAIFAVLGAYAMFTKQWDQATTLYVAAILLRTFVRD